METQPDPCSGARGVLGGWPGGAGAGLEDLTSCDPWAVCGHPVHPRACVVTIPWVETETPPWWSPLVAAETEPVVSDR